MALAERTADVKWNGTLADGSGAVQGGGGAIADVPVDWASSSGRAHGTTSPEELLAAAHASCYAMALTLLLARDGKKAEELDVKATCALEERGDWYTISSMELAITGRVPDLDAEAFEAAAREADEHCPISNALRDNVDIRLTATLG